MEQPQGPASAGNEDEEDTLEGWALGQAGEMDTSLDSHWAKLPGTKTRLWVEWGGGIKPSQGVGTVLSLAPLVFSPPGFVFPSLAS